MITSLERNLVTFLSGGMYNRVTCVGSVKCGFVF